MWYSIMIYSTLGSGTGTVYGIRLRTALCAIYIMHYTDRSTVLCLLYKYISVVLT
jgi:hypothetical protein